MENNDTSGTTQEEEGLSEEEMNNLKATLEDLFMSIDWDKVAEEDEEEDTQQ
jgi:hypothetical protein